MHHEDPETPPEQLGGEGELAQSDATQDSDAAQTLDIVLPVPLLDLEAPSELREKPIGWLIGLEGELCGRMILLGPGTMTIGASAMADVVIEDRAISRMHCRVNGFSGAQQLVDLGSINGTYINDLRISSAALKDRDRVRLGRREFIYRSSTFWTSDPDRPFITPAPTRSSRETMKLPANLDKNYATSGRFALAWLVRFDSVSPGDATILAAQRFVIGSGDSAQLLVHDANAEHCEVCRGDDGYTLRVLGDDDAMVTINGTKRHEALLSDGDMIEVASSLLRFQEVSGRAFEYGEAVVSGWLIGENPPLAGMVFPITERMLIGSAADCDLTIEDPLVSRRHCEIVPTETSIQLRDLGSTNGTHVNQLCTAFHELSDGDELRIGQALLLYKGVRLVRPLVETPQSEPASAHTPVAELEPALDPPSETFALAWLVPIEDNSASSPLLVGQWGIESDELEALDGYEFRFEKHAWHVCTVGDAAPFRHQGVSATDTVLADGDILHIDEAEYVFKFLHTAPLKTIAF